MPIEEKIRLWTCQTPAIFKMVMENGFAYCNQESWLYENFPKAYKWMAQQMLKRIGKPEIENVKLPLWAWKYYNGKSSPQPRRSIDLFGTSDEELIYMELLIPSNRLLASDFTQWNCAMGCLEAEIEDEDSNEDVWERIFNPDFNDSEWCVKIWDERCIQATFWCLFKEDIVYVDLLKKQLGKRALQKQRIYTNNIKSFICPSSL